MLPMRGSEDSFFSADGAASPAQSPSAAATGARGKAGLNRSGTGGENIGPGNKENKENKTTIGGWGEAKKQPTSSWVTQPRGSNRVQSNDDDDDEIDEDQSKGDDDDDEDDGDDDDEEEEVRMDDLTEVFGKCLLTDGSGSTSTFRGQFDPSTEEAAAATADIT